MSGFFHDEDISLSPNGITSWAKGARTNFKENAAAAFNAFLKSDAAHARESNLYNNYGELLNILQESGHTNLENPLLLTEPITFDEAGASVLSADDLSFESTEEKTFKFWKSVEELTKNDKNLAKRLTDASLNSPDALQKKIKTEAHDAYDNLNQISERATGWGVAGKFIGYAGGAFTDPVMLATIPLSMGYSLPYTIGGNLLKIAVMEAVIGFSAEAIVNIESQPYRKELEFADAGFKRGLMNTLMVSAGGAILGPLFYGVFKGVPGAVKALNKQLMKTSAPELKKVFKKITEIYPKAKNKDLENITFNDKDSPLVDNPKANIEHAQKIKTTIKNVLNDEPLEIDAKPTQPVKLDLTSPGKNLTKFNIDKLEFDPKTFQYKTGGDAYGLTGKLKNVTEWDQPSSGTIIVYEFASKEKFVIGDEVIVSKKGDKAKIIKEGFYNKIPGKTLDDVTYYVVETASGKNYSINKTLLKKLNAGRQVVVDGHQRLGLAKKLKDQGQEPELYGYVFREVDGINTEQAMVYGMAANLRNNTGTAIDAAKILRSKYGQKIIEKLRNSLPVQTKLVKEAEGLAKLDPIAFDLALNGKVNQTLASRVGMLIDDKSVHVSILTALKNKKFDSVVEMDIFLRSINRLPKTTLKQQTLFGEEELSSLLMFERSKLISYAVKNIKSESQAFSTIVKKGDILSAAGNILNKDKNAKNLFDRQKILDFVEQVASREGELSTDLHRAAKLYQDGNKIQAQKDFINAIDRAASRGDFDGVNVSRPIRADETQTEVPRGPKTKDDPTDVKDFAEVGGKGVKDQANYAEGELFGELTPKSIRNRVDASVAERTSPAAKEEGTQALPSQRTVSEPPSSDFASATIVPPKFRGATDSNKVIGDVNDINNSKILQNSEDSKVIHSTLKAKLQDFENFIDDISNGFTKSIDIRVKKYDRIAAKLKEKGITASGVSDYLAGRIHFENIDDARSFLKILRQNSKLLEVDDFMIDNPALIRTSKKDSGYRAIHVQVMTRDGFSAELQIRLMALEKGSQGSYKAYAKYRNRNLTAEETAKMEVEVAHWKKVLNTAWFKYRDTSFSFDKFAKEIKKEKIILDNIKRVEKSKKLPEIRKKLQLNVLRNRLNEIRKEQKLLAVEKNTGVDDKVAVDTRIDEGTGEIVPLYKTARELFEEDAKDIKMLERLKGCI